MTFFRAIRNIFKIEALVNKLLYTFAVLLVFRFGKHVPIPGINIELLNTLSQQIGREGFLAYLNLMSGGALGQCSIFSIGISPYITASIGMQFLVLSFPYLEALSKEGESGRNIINQYTRYLAFFMSLFQGITFVTLIERGGLFNSKNLILSPGWGFRLGSVLVLSAGAMFVMWLGEQITKNGIGQGASVLIFASIVSGIPSSSLRLLNNVYLGEMSPLIFFGIAAFIFLMLTSIVFFEKGEKRIPICYAKKVMNKRGALGGITTYMPLKINPSGVMPVILAMPALAIFVSAFKYAISYVPFGSEYVGLFDYGSLGHNLLTVVFIFWFNFAYTSIIFNPEEIADNLKKSGGFIPGIRPGFKTANFFDFLLNRILVSGSFYMAVLAVLPALVLIYFSSPIFFSGLSVLIAVGVSMEIFAQVESYLIENRYEGFFSK